MKKCIIRIICLALCALLLCSCAPAETAQQEKPFELPKLPEGMHNVPEAYALDRLDHSRIWFAGAHVELFNMLNPDTYVYYQSPISSGGGREVRISGPGCEEFVNSEIAANDWYDYKYKTEYFDLQRSDPIPRKPGTEGQLRGRSYHARAAQRVPRGVGVYTSHNLHAGGLRARRI